MGRVACRVAGVVKFDQQVRINKNGIGLKMRLFEETLSAEALRC
jgi:hypothetical protein